MPRIGAQVSELSHGLFGATKSPFLNKIEFLRKLSDFSDILRNLRKFRKKRGLPVHYSTVIAAMKNNLKISGGCGCEAAAKYTVNTTYAETII